MCGIVGWVKHGSGVSFQSTADAVNLLRHRGPDRQKVLVWSEHQGFLLGDAAAPPPETARHPLFRVGMGHARLSIIDLDPRSDQPMISGDGRYALIYNGEIYNYRDLRRHLESTGIAFQTESDTEVVLNAFMVWGVKATKHFNGMWGLAFFDSVERTILLSRDRYGKKPLLYLHSRDDFVFASEYKSIFSILGETRRELNSAFLDHFLAHSRWDVPRTKDTAYRGVLSIQPGATVRYSLRDHSLAAVFSDDIENYLDQQLPNPSKLADELESAVNLRLRSDVPVGILLSGGVDSTIVAAYAKRIDGHAGQIRWYAGDTGAGCDVPYARQVAQSLGVSLVEVNVSAKNNPTLEIAEAMTAQYELPTWLLGNSIAMFQMYRAMKADGIRVVLDGTGGDEVFGGYFNYFAQDVVVDMLLRGNRFGALRFALECGKYGHYPQEPLLDKIRASRLPQGINPAIDNKIPGLAEAQLAFIRTGNLPNWLIMNDQNSMAHSIEARSPLLDYRFIKYLRLPTNRKFHLGFNKYTLRQQIPPTITDAVRWRRDKQGFRWQPGNLYLENKERIVDTISSSRILSAQYQDLVGNIAANDPAQNLRLYAVAELERINLARR